MSIQKSGEPSGQALGISVGELVAALQAYDARQLVVVPGQNAGFVGVAGVRPVGLKLFVNAHPDFGPHEVPSDQEGPDLTAVVLVGHV